MGDTVTAPNPYEAEPIVCQDVPDPQPYGFDGLGRSDLNGTYTSEGGQILTVVAGLITVVEEPA